MDLIKGIKIKLKYSTHLINKLEIRRFFKNKNKKEGAGVTGFIIAIVVQLRRDISKLVISI